MLRLTKFLQAELSTELIAPLILIICYIVFLVIARGAIPTSDELLAHFSLLYQSYGYEIILVGSALEALVLVNFFVPGAVAVALGAVFARAGQLDLTFAVLAAIAGAMLGFIIDYFLGYFGFGQVIKRMGYGEALDLAKKRIHQSEVKTFGLGFIHPNLGSLVSLAAGTLEMNILRFINLSLLSTIIWVSFWGIVVYLLGEVFLTILSRYAFLIFLIVGCVWILMTLYGKSKAK